MILNMQQEENPAKSTPTSSKYQIKSNETNDKSENTSKDLFIPHNSFETKNFSFSFEEKFKSSSFGDIDFKKSMGHPFGSSTFILKDDDLELQKVKTIPIIEENLASPTKSVYFYKLKFS